MLNQWHALSLAALTAVLTGCGGDSVPRHQIKGEVTFQGKPVQMGTISFTADASVGNAAPVCYAQIKDGKYETKVNESPTSGKYTVQLMGIDVEHAVLNPPPGELPDLPALFMPYSTAIEVPVANGMLDIEVPTSQAMPKRQ